MAELIVEQYGAFVGKHSERVRVTVKGQVSRDIISGSHSWIIDAQRTMTLNKRVGGVLDWYDNEWGYSVRLVDFVKLLGLMGF